MRTCAITLVLALLVSACGGDQAQPAGGTVASPSGAAPAIAAPRIDIEKAKQEGKVSFYTAAGNEKLLGILADAFKAKYGITVEYFQTQNAPLLTRFQADVARGSSPDLISVSDKTSMESLIQGKYIASFIPPSAEADFPADLMTSKPYAYPYGLIAYGAAFNVNSVGSSDVAQFATWGQVLDQKWTGKFGLVDPNIAGGFVAVMWVMRQTLGEIGWRDMQMRLGALKPKMYNSNNPLVSAIASGELTAAWTLDLAANSQIGAGAPIGYAFPTPTPATYGLVAVVESAPHPNAARLFLDWYLSEEGQTLWSNNFGDTPANPKAKVESPMRKATWFKAPTKMVFLDKAPTPDEQKALLQEFNRLVLGR